MRSLSSSDPAGRKPSIHVGFSVARAGSKPTSLRHAAERSPQLMTERTMARGSLRFRGNTGSEFRPTHDRYFGREGDTRPGQIWSQALNYFPPDLRNFFRRKTRESCSQLIGHVQSQRPEILTGEWHFDVETQQTLALLPDAGRIHNAQQLSRFRKTKGVRAIGRDRLAWKISIDDAS